MTAANGLCMWITAMPARSCLEETLSIHRSAHALRPEQFMARNRLEQRHHLVRMTLPCGQIILGMERAMGIEPTSSAWKAVALPLSYARILQPIYEMFPFQARQFVLVLFPHRPAAFAASCRHRDTVGKSRFPGKHLFVKSRFFWSSRSSATSFPFNLPGNPPSREFSRPTT